MKGNGEILYGLAYIAMGTVYLHNKLNDLSQTVLTGEQLANPTKLNHGLRDNDDSIPKFIVDPIFRQEQDRIDTSMDDETRCAQYGVKALPPDQKGKRRLFFGSLLANENPEVLLAHAIEVYNKYDVIAFVEANTTFEATSRALNYGKGSIAARKLMESEFFGSQTKVVIDYWLKDEPHLKGLDREAEQRNVVWKLWVDQGMTRKDVGILADVDEVVSRDFLEALKVCDFPKLRENRKPSCQKPKMNLSTIQFESSPLCIKENLWYHPDIIPGNCVLGVGDPSGRATPERGMILSDETPAGLRKANWGMYDLSNYARDIQENKRYPLWDARDIRQVHGNDEPMTNFVHRNNSNIVGTAYHFHNWFKDFSILRHKHVTYGHPDPKAAFVPISKIGDDQDMMVRCLRDLGNKNTSKVYYHTNVHKLGGNRPIYFQNQTYVQERHALAKQILLNDEKQHGSVYM